APFIVFDDADIELAVKGAMASKFRNAGQTCVCANRFYVHDSVYDAFVNRFKQEVEKLVVGNGLDDGVTVGPVIEQKAKENILALIETAVEQGATQLTGKASLDGLFIQPCILTDVRHDMDIVQEEIFGPVAPVIRFHSD
ncbi:aldehyde dehydrogenase family protein, partial [Vibrio fluvialis]|nr:aldehyde dehydrogenase family protein [Vibrio fluvialis]